MGNRICCHSKSELHRATHAYAVCKSTSACRQYVNLWQLGIEWEKKENLRKYTRYQRRVPFKAPTITIRKVNTLYCIQKKLLKEPVLCFKPSPKTVWAWRITLWLTCSLAANHSWPRRQQWHSGGILARAAFQGRKQRSGSPGDSSAWNRMVRDLLFRSLLRGIARATKVQGFRPSAHGAP